MDRPTALVADTCSETSHPKVSTGGAIPSAQSLERASRLCRALGDPSRLRLLARLRTSEVCVTDLANAEGEEISTISQRLRVLRAENIVVRKRRGKHLNYALADRHIANLIDDVLEHASEPMTALTEEGKETE